MDIYDYINSKDVAAYCREINKVWTPFEMAVIIRRSDRPMAEKHSAWRELISDYPDMPTPKNMHNNSFDSLHQKLRELIDYEERLLALFKLQEPDTVYLLEICRYDDYISLDYVFSSFDKLWADVLNRCRNDEAPKIRVTKMKIDGAKQIDAIMDYNGDINHLNLYGNGGGWFSLDDLEDMFEPYLFYIDIPFPFKPGDILTLRSNHLQSDATVFVLECLTRDDEYFRNLIDRGEVDGSDMIEWGLFVSESGVLYGDHTGDSDSFEYYRGKLEGAKRLLHYVSLFMNGKIHLPELLTMQSRIKLEHQLENNLLIQSHGCFISESQFAENRLTKQEKENIEKNDGLMPWVVGKLSIHHVHFLMAEFGGSSESVQNGLADGGGSYLGMCAGIVHDENHYEKNNDSKFNPARRAMARMFLEAYGHTEKGWENRWA